MASPPDVVSLVLAELRALRAEMAALRTELGGRINGLHMRVDELERQHARARGVAVGVALAAGTGTAAAAEVIKGVLGG